MPAIARMDESLLEARKVLGFEFDDAGMGYEVQFDCGHDVWMPVLPPAQTQCAMCLEILVRQIRMVQGRQEPR